MITAWTQLKNPPIKEAIFTITFKLSIALDKIDSFINNEYVTSRYPIKQPEYLSHSVKSEATQELTESIERPLSGYTLKCEGTCNRLIKIRQSHISYHNFDKYIGWETMFGELKDIWKEFCLATGGVALSQLSVRYINHINIPLPLQNGLGEYLKILPIIPDGINKSLNSFFIQLSIPNEQGDLIGTITETVLPPSRIESQTFTLLIDLTVNSHSNEYECNRAEMWDTFGRIRDYKNLLFFNSITTETKKLFD